MTKPRTLAAILLLSALAAPALAQGAGPSDTGTPPPPAGSQSGTSSPAPSPPPSPGPVAGGTEQASPRPALVRNPTSDVQERLQQLGLYSGDIDGKWGPQTRGAVVEFQRSHGLRPSGTLDVATLARLREMTQNAPPAQDETAGQQPTPDTGAGGNTAQAIPPVRRPPGSSTSVGSKTSPGSSTTARATVTVPGLAVPGLGVGNGIYGNNFGAAPEADTGAGVGLAPPPSFFGTPLNLSNGFNAAVGQ
ncbi:MAG: peptidoglycan-binding protein [Acetobacteraceae bacterium]|nr:peptidoglycan-binding protein [Acetobacteraceae bacterium]